jgi:RimJ/RimL family protein N-acetyltransferase
LERSTTANAEPTQVGQWLRAGDWPLLRIHFTHHAPATAEEFSARGLVRLRSGSAAQQVHDGLADLRQAASLEPRSPLHQVNLAQGLIDTGHPSEALHLARDLVSRFTHFLPALEKHCLALHACGHWDDARAALARLVEVSAVQGLQPPPQMQALGAILDSRWWHAIPVGGAALRLPRADDEADISRWLADDAFMARYHRFEARHALAARQYIGRAQQPPDVTRRREWIVQDRHGRAAGFAALVDIDLPNARAELLVGIPGADASTSLALKAAVAAMAFAFRRLPINKLVSHVYGDNPRAQDNTRHLGFTPEGRLREHLRFGDRPVDLLVNGLLVRDHDASVALQRLHRRWLTPEGGLSLAAAARPAASSIPSFRNGSSR